jgi:hypothetical protein
MRLVMRVFPAVVALCATTPLGAAEIITDMVACVDRDRIFEIARADSDEAFEAEVNRSVENGQCRILKEGLTVVVNEMCRQARHRRLPVDSDRSRQRLVVQN